MININTRLYTIAIVVIATIISASNLAIANVSGSELAETAINNLKRTNFIGRLRTQSRVLGRTPSLFEIQHRSGYPYRLIPQAENVNLNYYILEHPDTADHIDINNKRILPDAGQRPIGLMTKVVRQRFEPINAKDWKVEDSTYLGFKVRVFTTKKGDYIKAILEQSRQFPLLIEISENGRRIYDFKFESIQFVSFDLVPISLFEYPANYSLIKLSESKQRVIIKMQGNSVVSGGATGTIIMDTSEQPIEVRRSAPPKPQFLPLIPRDLPEDWLLNNIIVEPYGSELIYRFEFINDRTNRIISIFQLDDAKMASPLTQNRQVGGFNMVTGELLGITYVIVGRESVAVLNSFASKLIRNDALATQILQALEP